MVARHVLVFSAPDDKFFGRNVSQLDFGETRDKDVLKSLVCRKLSVHQYSLLKARLINLKAR